MCGLPEHRGFKRAKRHDVHIQKMNIRHPIRGAPTAPANTRLTHRRPAGPCPAPRAAQKP